MSNQLSLQASPPSQLVHEKVCEIDSVFPYKGVAYDSIHTWLIYSTNPRQEQKSQLERSMCISNRSATRSLSLNPPLPSRTWTEKQYHPQSAPTDTVSNFSILTFFVAVLCSLLFLFIRRRYWKYYSEYFQLLFHPRSLQRVYEIDGLGITTFHILIDGIFFLSLSLLFVRLFHNFFSLEQHLPFYSIFFFPVVVFFFFSLYSLRYLILYASSRLIGQAGAAMLIWRQYMYIHRFLVPTYLLLALLALFSSPVISTCFAISGVGLYVLASLYALLRIFVAFLWQHYNLFYYFLYLCVLEIAPIVGLLRWLQFV